MLFLSFLQGIHMRTCVLAFLMGVLWLQLYATLPSYYWIIVLLLFALLNECILVKKYRYFRCLTAGLIGFVWTLWYANSILTWNLPKEWEGKPLLVKGYIATIPNISEHRTSFLFKVKNIQSQPIATFIKLSIQNSNYIFHAGEQWQFVVHLKRIHGMMNPGGFDYEAWSFQDGIRASGYVSLNAQAKLLSHHWYHYFLNQLRESLQDKIKKNLPESATSAWISALALGERQNISADKWEILRNTGTNHLMAIAGLHIGFMSGFIFLLVNVCWRQFSFLTLNKPSHDAAAIAALVMALIYSALAGFSIPTQRACIMLTVSSMMLIMRKISISWNAWCFALFCVLLFNPLSILTMSFWLSFGSVALIIYGVSNRLAPSGLWWKLGRMQWIIALGLIPLSIGLFQQCSFVSFIANSIAIPWIGFLVVPLTLLGCFILLFSTVLGSFVLSKADQMLSYLWTILTYFSHMKILIWYHVIPEYWILIVASLGVIFLLSPVGFPGRYFGLIWFLPLVFYHYSTPALGKVWFTLLDVGQGLSAIIQTKNHVMVFDAGPKLSSNYDMGESVVTPFLHSIGAKKIDMLIVSHGDNDHVGGAGALFSHFPVLTARTSDPVILLPFIARYCLRGEKWKWDGVQFEFLYPTEAKLNLDNNSSCVLRVTDANQKHILLTGDIEKLAENELVQIDPGNLSADILVAPHHGSKTSAVASFVNDVNPKYVLFPVGYRNRYHFPHAMVIEKYQRLQAVLFSTEESGAIQFGLSKNDLPMQYRITHRHYWNE